MKEVLHVSTAEGGKRQICFTMDMIFLVFCFADAFHLLFAASVKLTSSSSSSTFIKGILNVNHNGEWGTVCDDGWDIRDTNVACRQLGHGKGLAHMHLGEGSGKIWLDNMRCTGSESSLGGCTSNGWGTHDCSHSEDIGIVCQIVPDVDVRLVGGSVANEGRVEVQFNSLWGTVCDDYWTTNNANVICKKLGYQNAIRSRSFGSGSGQIWLDDVFCKGDEDTIAACRHRGWGIENCVHSEDIGVVCQPKGSPDISVRLVSGSAPNIGRVEVRYYGVWRSICDTNWDVQDARVICKMKGFSRGALAFIKGLQSSDDPWLFNLGCSGHESSIENCANINWRKGSCANNKRAGVVCNSGSPNMAFRLTSGINNYVGRLEVRYYGTWGAVCSNTITLVDTHVVCRTLGYGQAVTFYQKSHTDASSMFFMMMRCTGSETSVVECQQNAVRSSQVKSCIKDVWIICKPTSGLSWNTNFRLVGGATREEGRVEIQHFGVWGTVCNIGWDIQDAKVVCRALNFTGAITSRQTFGSGTGPIWLTGLRCRGDEKDVLNCVHNGLGKTKSCSHSNDAGVVCHSYPVQDPKVAVRLVDGKYSNQGRVEVRYYGVWGTVCDDGWGPADAHVVCRMLNYYKASWAGTSKVHGSGIILLDDVQCRGNEKSLEYCSGVAWGRHNCGHSEDAAIKCERATKEETSVTARLVKIEQRHVGQVQVNYDGTWRSVCDDTWDIADAHVICRMLRYKAALAPIRQSHRGVNGLWMGGVECSGDEVSIGECYHRGWGNTRCPGNYYAGVMCKVTEDLPVPIGVRLEDGHENSTKSGRIGVRYGNVWGTICDRGLDINDAKVICRMLGYPGASRVYPKSAFRPGNGTIWLSNLECNGTEKSIVDCRHPGWGNSRSCNHGDDGAIACKIADPPQFLIDRTSAITDSKVQIFFNESQITEAHLTSYYQVAVERKENEKRFRSYALPPPFIYNEVNVTMATEMGSHSYITAEILGPISNLTVGDGQYYHGYYNAPLEPGSMYRVHVRIVTMAVDGKAVRGYHSFVAFTTKSKIVKELTMKASFLSDGKAIGLSVVIVILTVVITAGIAWYFLKRRNKTQESTTLPMEGLEMNKRARCVDHDTAAEYYESPPARQDYDESQLYINTQTFHDTNPRFKRTVQQSSSVTYAPVKKW